MTPVSVIVVSRGRPGLLPRCLTGLSQLCHPSFEIVVVADPGGVAAVRALGWEGRVKLVAFDEANISAARNAGLRQAAGELIAFLDDDAVPEPTWLGHLVAPLHDSEIAATGGYVIGRNGISFQWRARAVDASGFAQPIAAPGEAPFEPDLPPGLVTKTEGTNCAFRRSALATIGGFDPAFHYFLDETDVNLRLAQAGGRTILVPLARVHHGYAASARRAGDRAPADLTQVGASTAVFLRKHAPADAVDRARAQLLADQRRGLVGHMVEGGLEPRDIARLLAGLEAGFAAGLSRRLGPCPPLGSADAPFLAFTRSPASGVSRYFAGRPWNRTALRRQAAKAVAAGDVVTLLRFSHTSLPHRVTFHRGGWWEQRGGLFGKAERNEPFFRMTTFRARARREWMRVAELRQCRSQS